MALAPAFAPHRLGLPTASHVLELWLDFVCPFSAKQLLGVKEHLANRVEDGDLKEKLSIIIRQVPQPWHSSSTQVHEAFLAVSTVAPSKTIPFAYALMEAQKDYFDANVKNESPSKTKERLAAFAEKAVGVSKKEVLDQIQFIVKEGELNSGSKVTNNLKLQVKLGRQNGIHVTPTASLDGLVDGTISSSWGKKEWDDWVQNKILA